MDQIKHIVVIYAENRMPTVSKKPKAPSARQREVLDRRTRWRQMAIAQAKRHPSWSILQVAVAIQRSSAGKKRDGPLRYSVSNIVKQIRDIW